MQEELRRSNSIGSAEGINRFLEMIFISKIQGIEAINHNFRFSSPAQFNCRLALQFFSELGLIKLSASQISLTETGDSLSNLSLNHQKERISEIVFDYLSLHQLINLERITIDSQTGELRIPTNVFSLSSAIFRNFLIEIECFSKASTHFTIKNKQLHTRIETKVAIEKRKMSQDELVKKLQKQQEDGDLGELFVLEYEAKRLAGHSSHPKRISLIDVSAGYDILSFHNIDSQSYNRYIEVKSYRGSPHFYWSANERRIAEALNTDYFLYLVNLSAMENDRNQYVPQIIRNPAQTLCADDWIIEPNSFLVTSVR